MDDINRTAAAQARTSQLEHLVAELLVFIFQVMALPGDVFLTGAPTGVGPLEAGGRVEVELQGIGVLPTRSWPSRRGAENVHEATAFGPP